MGDNYFQYSNSFDKLFPNVPDAVDINERYKKHSLKLYSLIALVCFLAFGSFSAYVYVAVTSNTAISTDLAAVSSTNGLFSLSSTNDYGTFDTSTNYYPFLSSSLLLEPHRTSVVALQSGSKICDYSISIAFADDYSPAATKSSTTNDDDDDDINSDDNIYIKNIHGYSWDVTIKKTGHYNATITAICGSATVVDYLSIWVKYVRRELSSLSDDDKQDFLDALYTVYTVNTIDGRELYGPSYVSVQYLSAIHVDAAGNPVCDEFHSGDGFFGNHVYLGNFVEQSMQLVNPKVALHFMEYAKLFSSDDYVVDHMSDQLDGGTWNPYLTEDYFGEADPLSGDLTNSIWADIPMPVVDSAFFTDHGIGENTTFFPDEEEEWLKLSPAHLRSPFSLLRPPWNFNPSLTIGRYTNEVGIESIAETSDYTDYFSGANCADYESFVETYVLNNGGADFNTILKYVKSYLHGGIHENIGGQGGTHAREVDAILEDTYGLDDDDIFVISERAHAFFKKYVPMASYYNDSEYPVYPLNCGSDMNAFTSSTTNTVIEPGLAGGLNCTCVDYYFESADNLNDLMTMYFDKYMKSKYVQNSTPTKIAALGFDDNVAIMKLMCERMAFDGDFVGSGSAFDPIFWVSHPPMEMIMQRLSLAGYFTNGYNFTTPNSCSGHSPTAYPAWLSGYILDDAATNASSLTNHQLTWMLNPMEEEYQIMIPYIYDNNHNTGCTYVDDLLSID
jgi:hypothetical protein